jgi:hypothetical protein
MSLLPFFEWCEATPVGAAIRESLWLFPVIEACHLVAFAVIGGTILVVDLRLLGIGGDWSPVARLARGIQPWLVGALAIMIPSGILLFLSEAIKCYYSFPFWVKMWALLLALTFTFTLRRRVVAADPAAMKPAWRTAAGALSLLLWSAVAWGGRWIGFSG